MSAPGFTSEAQLVRSGRRLINSALKELDAPVATRYEVRASGSIPDLVIYSSCGYQLRYVVTVEFKLSNWRRALLQAFRHRNFVNEAYVVLDRTRAEPAIVALSLFEQANVGLATVDRAGTARIWHSPEPRLPFSSDFARSLAETLLAPRQKSTSTFPFIRSTRGGIALAALKTAWAQAGAADCE